MGYWGVAAIHIVLAFCLFFLVNWFGSKSGPLGMGYVQISLDTHDVTAPAFNYLFKVLAPVVFMIILYATFQYFNLSFLNTNIYSIG